MKLATSMLTLFAALTLPAFAADSIHDFKVKDIDGKEVALSGWKGKPVLFVNVASRCGFTKQYKDLVELNKKYASKGLVIAGFPANNFGGQEPGTNGEIKQFCTSRFSVDFPMFEKVSVKGNDQHPLFGYLTSAANPDFDGNIRWNFEKFLIDGKGKVVRRFRSNANPTGPEITGAVDDLLKAGK